MHCALFEAGHCRSCTDLRVPYVAQLQAKQQRAMDQLALPALRWLPALASAEAGFRNKAKMAIGGTLDAPLLGLVPLQGEPADLSDCALYLPAIRAAFPLLREFIQTARITPYDPATRRGEGKFALLTCAPSGEMMLRWVLRSTEALSRIQKYAPALQARWPALRVHSVNLLPEPKAVVEGDTEILLPGDEALCMQVNDVPLYLRPQSFFQTHTEVAAQLYAQARQWMAQIQPQHLWDLFCGVGGFALHCAPHAQQVTGIEISPEAIASARRSCAALAIRNVAFQALDASAFGRDSDASPDAILVNPPRRGIGSALCEQLQRSGARDLIYSSCNIDTLCADLHRMPAYRAVEARLLDMFPHTAHFETLIWLRRDG